MCVMQPDSLGNLVVTKVMQNVICKQARSFVASLAGERAARVCHPEGHTLVGHRQVS